MTAIADSAGGAGETVLVAGGQDWQQVVDARAARIPVNASSSTWGPSTRLPTGCCG